MSKQARKQAAAKQQVAETSATKSLYGLKPKWAFALADYGHERWGISTNADRIVPILQYLGGLERLAPSQTWREILTDTSNRKGNTRNHVIRIADICRDAQKRLEELKLDDRDKLLSIAAASLTRVWGIVDEDGVCYILWIDPGHDIYPTEAQG
jgi:hypothetical protein